MENLIVFVALLGFAFGSVELRVCFQEVEDSSQCQADRSSCSGWSGTPSWTSIFRDDTDGRSGGCGYEWKLDQRENGDTTAYEYRLLFRETEGSSQCQGDRTTETGWSSNPDWSAVFRDDTDDRGGGCYYQWKIEQRPYSGIPAKSCQICFQETEGSSQCQGARSTCSGFSDEPAWTDTFETTLMAEVADAITNGSSSVNLITAVAPV